MFVNFPQLFLKKANLASFSFIFGLFKTNNTILQQINVKIVHPVYGAGIVGTMVRLKLVKLDVVGLTPLKTRIIFLVSWMESYLGIGTKEISPLLVTNITTLAKSFILYSCPFREWGSPLTSCFVWSWKVNDRLSFTLNDVNHILGNLWIQRTRVRLFDTFKWGKFCKIVRPKYLKILQKKCWLL